MAVAKKITYAEFDEFTLGESGRLPNGIWFWKSDSFDIYTGYKLALIESRQISADWFPAEPLPPGCRSGTRKCAFRFASTSGEVDLRHLGKGRWQVTVPLSSKECESRKVLAERRLQEQRNQEQQQREVDEQRRREDERQRLKILIDALPPFVPGDLDDAEIVHLRALRAVSDRSYNFIASLIVQSLLDDARDGKLVQALRRRLRLVVSNDTRSTT